MAHRVCVQCAILVLLVPLTTLSALPTSTPLDFPPLESSSSPSPSYPARSLSPATMSASSTINSSLSEGYSPSSVTPELRAVQVFLWEQCYRNMDLQQLMRQLPEMHFVPKDVVCGVMPTSSDLAGMDGVLQAPQALADAVSAPWGRVLGSPPPSLCEAAHWLAQVRRTALVTWTCPQERRYVERRPAVRLRLAPPVQETARAVAAVALAMRWKTVAIVHTDSGWWQSLAHALDLNLRKFGILYKHLVSVSSAMTVDDVIASLQRLHRVTCRVILVCASADESGFRTLEALDRLRLAELHDSLTMLLDVSTLPMWLPTFLDAKLATHTKNNSGSNNNYNAQQYSYYSYNAREEISSHTKKYILLFTDTEVNLSHRNYTTEALVLERIQKSLTILNRVQASLSIEERNPKFVILDLRDDDSWRPLIRAEKNWNTSDYMVQRIESNFEEWILKHSSQEDDCDSCTELSAVAKTTQVLLVLLCSTLLVAILLGATLLCRNHLLKKRISKGPYKVLLTAADFVFPQVADTRRVDEGIEAMLCCWLQQLQEFGGPEVDKPDLLKGSVGSLKGHLAAAAGRSGGTGGSSNSLARTLVVDPRVRYNGDLVQLKPLATSGGSSGLGSGSTFELKSKALDILLVLHGLRHENLNPILGCLNEPTRPALVWEWGTRGSLEDVLVQDEIKLDWSFRLSLLTDLVRGMRYLHSSPVRVHGYLTSRNCVIDARWVLKITDYGLPGFYEAQGIAPPTKTARQLLWTAPELLRNAGLLKKGTQPGDVYSFGIIMQEVVVRGEPFCMLALTPEEIIEKVKRPPPLIRPSVSKGAAPPEAINIMRQCWAEQADMRPDFNAVHDLFKKLNHGRKVNIVDTMFQMLEKYSNNLEELIRERTSQLDMEKKKTEQLLNRMLPSSVAEKLKLGMPVDPEEFSEVTIYFSDIVGFTTISAYSTPFQVVDLLNDLYTCFDATINAYNVYKVETIGDAYMVVGGLPVRIPDHADQIATMALDLLHQSGRFKIRHLPKTPLRLRIGLHTGSCCAGVVGLTMPRYCLFGDTVNTASRMESTGSAWRIHLSQATKERLDMVGGYQLEYRGPTEVKGKGRMHTYWLLGKGGFDKTLPIPPSIGLDESLVICGRSESSRANSFNNRSEDNSSADGSAYSVPVSQTSPKTHESTMMKVSAHIHDDQQHPHPLRTFQTLEPSKLMKDQGFPGYFSVGDTPLDDLPRPIGNSFTSSNPGVKDTDPTFLKSMESSKFLSKNSILEADPNSSLSIKDSDATFLKSMESSKFSTILSKSNPIDVESTKYAAFLSKMESDSVKSNESRTLEHGMTVGSMVKSTSSDTPMSLGTPVSSSELAAALLCASTTSLSNTGFRNRHRRVGVIDEDDLSTPYNHYRCLSPIDRSSMEGKLPSSIPSGGNITGGRMLKRQFSLDRGDDPSVPSSVPARLHKQNSAGATPHDLEMIEEVPPVPTPSPCPSRARILADGTTYSCSISVSVDSLTSH